MTSNTEKIDGLSPEMAPCPVCGAAGNDPCVGWRPMYRWSDDPRDRAIGRTNPFNLGVPHEERPR